MDCVELLVQQSEHLQRSVQIKLARLQPQRLLQPDVHEQETSCKTSSGAIGL